MLYNIFAYYLPIQKEVSSVTTAKKNNFNTHNGKEFKLSIKYNTVILEGVAGARGILLNPKGYVE